MKTLNSGEVFNTPYGTTWDSAILVVDDIDINYLQQTLRMRIDIYSDATARTENKKPFSEKFNVTKDEFLANFDSSEAISTLKSQCEDYALTLYSYHLQVVLGDLFG